ncbi:MAG: ABC transporter substrate-binding protein [Candidatus Bathyarchaeia archaeon]
MFSFLLGGTTLVKAEVREFVVTFNYDPPPIAHFNPWATGALFYGWWFTQEPLFWYLANNDTYIPWLGEKFEWDPVKKTLTVRLRRGVLWHDGRVFTSKDVLTTVYINAPLWYPAPGAPSRMLLNVTAPDEYTVVWEFNYTSPTAIPSTLYSTIQPYSLFGEWADELRRLAWSGANLTVLNEFRDRFLKECRPTTIVGTGPFKFKEVTDIEIIYEKFDRYWRGAENIKFDRVRVIRATSDVQDALTLQGVVHWRWGFYSKEAQMYAQAHPETFWIGFVPYGGISVVILNCHRYPLNIPEVRKAIYYAFNTTEYRNIAIPGEGLLDGVVGKKGLVYPLSVAYGLFGKDFVDGLNDYGGAKGADFKKAEEILLNLGFRKDTEGIWVTPNGTRLEFTCLYIPEWWAVLADAFVAQMSRFGIKITLVGTRWDPFCASLFRDHDYDIYLRFGTWYSIHPYTVMYNLFVARNSWEGIPAPYPLHEPQIVEAPGWVASWIVEKGKPWLVGERGINVTRLTIELERETDPEKMKEGLKFLTWYCNEYPFYLPYSLSGRMYVINREKVSGFPADTLNPLWLPYPYSDIFPCVLWISLGMFGPKVPYTGAYVLVYMLEKVPQFLGADGNYYGPYKRGDAARIPEEDAVKLIEEGLASYTPPTYIYVTAYAKTSIPAFTGVDGETYGPYREGDAMLIPKEDAERLVAEGKATYSPPVPAEIPEISGAVSDLLGRVSRLETSVSAVGADVSALSKKVDDLTGQISSTVTTITAIGAIIIILSIISIILSLRKK